MRVAVRGALALEDEHGAAVGEHGERLGGAGIDPELAEAQVLGRSDRGPGSVEGEGAHAVRLGAATARELALGHDPAAERVGGDRMPLISEPVLLATLRCLKPVAVRVATWMPSLASYATAPGATA